MGAVSGFTLPEPTLKERFCCLEVVVKPHRHFFNVTITEARGKKATNMGKKKVPRSQPGHMIPSWHFS